MDLCRRCNNGFSKRSDGRSYERRNLSSRLRLHDHECSVLEALHIQFNYKVTYLLRLSLGLLTHQLIWMFKTLYRPILLEGTHVFPFFSIFWTTIFTALRGMQTRSSNENVRPSVCPYVRTSVKRVNCNKTERKSVHIFIPYEISFSIVFWQKMVDGATPSTWNFGSTPVGHPP